MNFPNSGLQEHLGMWPTLPDTILYYHLLPCNTSYDIHQRDILIEENQVSSMDDGALIGLDSPFTETPDSVQALKEG